MFQMRVICLGTGTSYGVPMVGCDCPVCISPDPRNRRNRCSVVVELPEGKLLIDTPPELRLSCLRDNVRQVDAVALTHTHADHIMGMDDLRAFNGIKGGDMPIYAEPMFLEDVRRVFQYAFTVSQEGGGKPKLQLLPLEPNCSFPLLGAEILPLRVFHGEVPITSYRIGGFAYVTDVSRIPAESLERLRGLDILILGAIRDKPHSTHFCIEEAVDCVKELRPRRAYFTHFTHDVDHEELSNRLPAGVQPAYDGLVLEVN